MRGWDWLSRIGTIFGLILVILGVTAGGLVWFFTKSLWAGIAAVLALTLVVFAEGTFEVWQKVEERRFDPDAPLTAVVGKTFRNQDVPLDGFSYTNCHFHNVTFVFRGEKSYGLHHIDIHGPHFLRLEDRGAGAAVQLAKALGLQRTEVGFFDIDSGDPVDVPTPTVVNKHQPSIDVTSFAQQGGTTAGQIFEGQREDETP